MVDKNNRLNKLKMFRENAELTQKELAEKSGVSVGYIVRLESLECSPSLEITSKLAQALGISFLELIDMRSALMEMRSQDEYERLMEIFKDAPQDKLKIAEGLIRQAARLRVLLDDNWRDITENGEYEEFKQSENLPSYDRKRPIVDNYDSRDKTYKELISQLLKLLETSPDRKQDKRKRLLGG